MIAGIGHGTLGGIIGFLHLPLAVFPGLGDHAVRLVAVLRGQLAVPLQHLFRRQQLFLVPGPVRRHLRSSRAVDALLTEMVFDLFAARA